MKFKKLLQKTLSLNEGKGRSTAVAGTGFEKWVADNLNIDRSETGTGSRHSSIDVVFSSGLILNNKELTYASVHTLLVQEFKKDNFQIGFEELSFANISIDLFKMDGNFTSDNIENKGKNTLKINTENTDPAKLYDELEPNRSPLAYTNNREDPVEIKKTTGHPVYFRDTKNNKRGNLKVYMFSELKKIISLNDFNTQFAAAKVAAEKNGIKLARVQAVNNYNHNINQIKMKFNEVMEELDIQSKVDKLINEKISNLKAKNWYLVRGDNNHLKGQLLAIRKLNGDFAKGIKAKISKKRFSIPMGIATTGIDRLSIQHDAREAQLSDESFDDILSAKKINEASLNDNTFLIAAIDLNTPETYAAMQSIWRDVDFAFSKMAGKEKKKEVPRRERNSYPKDTKRRTSSYVPEQPIYAHYEVIDKNIDLISEDIK